MRVHLALRAEATADIRADHVNLFFAQAERLRAIRERARVGQRREQRLGVVNPYARGIRHGQIDQRDAAAPEIGEHGRETVRPPIVGNAPREHPRRIFDLVIG